MKKLSLLYIILSILFLSSCGEDLLETTNPKAPDLESTLQDPNEWEAVIAKQFNVIWHATQGFLSSSVMAGMADVYTSSIGNYGEYEATSEPRVAIPNDREGVAWVESSYYENFKVIGSANDILRLLKARPDEEVLDREGRNIREQLLSAGLFLRGMAYGNLALKYDKAQYVDEDTDLSLVSDLDFDNYQTLMDKAMADLEEAIATAQSVPDFSISYYNGVILNQADYTRLIRSLQAKYRMHISRDATENETNDWQTILNYAEQGLGFDFVVTGDATNWWDGFKWLTARGWARVDYRIIAAMAEDTPSRFPEDGSHPLPEPKALDQRLLADMAYVETIWFKPDRGLYHFSHYLYSRYGYHSNGIGPLPWILKAENDLIIAEALIRTQDDKARAAELINITRVGRGGLPALTGEEPDQVMLDAIMHEQMIELLSTNGSQPFYDRRRRPVDDGSFHPYSGLQPGTAKQWPVPARELNLLGVELYTYGGN